MANNAGSVAPKERVNITYRPAAEGTQEDVELPFKILVLGDFTGRPDDRAVEDRAPISVDKDNFDKVMAAQQLAVDITIPQALAGEPEAELPVSLKFNSLADFRPEGIVDQVKELSELKQLRDALRFLKTGTANGPTFIRKIQDLMKDKDKRARLLRELGLDESTT
jgi:type VI secretion system protein ImpB